MRALRKSGTDQRRLLKYLYERGIDKVMLEVAATDLGYTITKLERIIESLAGRDLVSCLDGWVNLTPDGEAFTKREDAYRD